MFIHPFVRHKFCFAGTVAAFSLLLIAFVACQATGSSNNFATDGDIVHTTYTDQDIILGLVPGVFVGRIIASDTTVNSVESDIWNGDADENLIWATDEDTVNISSSSILDDAGGVGAIIVRIDGLDNTFTPIDELVNLDGTTPVTSINEYARINRIIVTDVGIYGGSNVGTIDANFTTSGDLQARILPTYGMSQKSHYTLPDNHIGIIRNIIVTVESNKVVNFAIKFRTNDTLPPTTPTTTFIPFSLFSISGTIDFPLVSGQPLNARSDIWVVASQQNQTATTSIIIDFYIVDLNALPNVNNYVQLCISISILCS